MISNIPFNSFKNSAWVKSHKKRTFVLMISIVLATFLYYEVMIEAVIVTYTIGCLVYFLKNKDKMGGMFDWKSEYDEEHEEG